MAPTIAIPIPSSNYQEAQAGERALTNNKKKTSVEKDDEMEELKKRNAELERELRERESREQHLMHQLNKALERLRVAEEAEEMLCSQLGDLEVEAVEQARHFHSQISHLTNQLHHARLLLQVQSTDAVIIH